MEDVGMRTGATIHTENGLNMKLTRRVHAPVSEKKTDVVQDMPVYTLRA
jgi:hypothetical protein